MIASKSITIDGWVYDLRPASTSVCLLAGARLVSAVAPVFGALSKDATFMRAVAHVLSNPEFGPTLDYLARSFAPFTTVSGPGGSSLLAEDKPGGFGFYEVHFAGRTAALLAWLEFAVESNLSDFLGALSGVIDRAKAKVLSDSTAPKDAATSG